MIESLEKTSVQEPEEKIALDLLLEGGGGRVVIEYSVRGYYIARDWRQVSLSFSCQVSDKQIESFYPKHLHHTRFLATCLGKTYCLLIERIDMDSRSMTYEISGSGWLVKEEIPHG